jgi:hypothetical protein
MKKDLNFEVFFSVPVKRIYHIEQHLFFRDGTILRLPFTSIADPVPAQQ